MKKIFLTAVFALVSVVGISTSHSIEAKNYISHQTEINVASTQRCKAITKSGNRCKRNAQPGSKYCWQHSK